MLADTILLALGATAFSEEPDRNAEEKQLATNGEALPMDHEGMSLPTHAEAQLMQMEHSTLSHGMCGGGKCMSMMGIEGMDDGSTSAAAKAARKQSYGRGRSGGRGCGC
jgi:hypothetical protein